AGCRVDQIDRISEDRKGDRGGCVEGRWGGAATPGELEPAAAGGQQAYEGERCPQPAVSPHDDHLASRSLRLQPNRLPCGCRLNDAWSVGPVPARAETPNGVSERAGSRRYPY